MKTISAFSLIILFSSCMYVNAQDSTFTEKVLDAKISVIPKTQITLKNNKNQEIDLNNQLSIAPILNKSNQENNEIVAIAYGNVRKTVNEYPVKIPNAYKSDNCIEIPNAYKYDRSVDIPNADLKSKRPPIPKITPKLIP